VPYDLFISYSRRDNAQGCITQLVERIKQDFAAFAGRELVPFFDHQEIKGMEDWRQRILQGLRESRLLLTFLSPGYIESGYCEWEFIEYLKYEIGHLHGFNGVAPIYFVPVPGWDDKDFDQRCAAWIAELRRRQHFDLRPWHEQGEDALREAGVRERLIKLNRQIADTILRGERAEKCLGNVDAHNPHFIGRAANLRLLRENFVKPGHIGVLTAVNGLGGLGKTALAVEYAHAFADQYGGGRWQIRCEGKNDLRLALSELATPIGFEFTDDEKKNLDLQFERTRRELKKLADACTFGVPPSGGRADGVVETGTSNPGPPKGGTPNRCLLILDNVDRPQLLDPAQVARLNASDWLHVLATTRLGENELHGTHRDRSFLAVDELPPDDALALIETYQPGGRFRSDAEHDAAREIVQLLGCFTLAVESAAVYLGQFAHDVTCAAFLARLKREGLDGLDTAATQSSEGVLHGEKRLGVTLRPTLERLNAPEKLALNFAALLPADHIALPWLRALVTKTFPEMACDAEPGHPDPWKNLLRRLFSMRLLQSTGVMDADGQPLVVRVHRLLQQLMLRDCPAPERAGLQQTVDSFITQRGDALPKAKNWIELPWELEPLTALARLWDEANHPSAGWLTTQSAGCWYQLAEWSRAEPLMKRALVIDEQSFGPEHSEVALSLNNLANLLKARNRFEEAEPLMRRALMIWERSLGLEHPRVATALNNLSLLLKDTNRLAEAELLMRRALAIDEQSVGLEHPNVAVRLHNLSLLLKATNRLTEAEPLIQRALVIFERSFGANHPNVSTALNTLGNLLYETNRLPEAEPLMRRAIAIVEQSFGPEHPAVANNLNDLAQLLQATNRPTEAEPLMRRALAINEQSFGPEHPKVALSLSNLARLLLDMNRLTQVEPLMRRALAIDEQSFGMEHPAVATKLNNLASLYYSTNRLAEAEPMYRRVISIFETSLGADHPNVASSLNNLANLLQDTNRTAEAELLIRRALAITEQSFGPDHPAVAISLSALGRLYYRTNLLAKAEPLTQRMVEIFLKFSKSTGHRHPHLNTGVASYAMLLSKMGHSPAEVQAQLDAVARPYGIQFGEPAD
jgi:tetratricopeptide (TPR) repeat protein